MSVSMLSQRLLLLRLYSSVADSLCGWRSFRALFKLTKCIKSSSPCGAIDVSATEMAVTATAGVTLHRLIRLVCVRLPQERKHMGIKGKGIAQLILGDQYRPLLLLPLLRHRARSLWWTSSTAAVRATLVMLSHSLSLALLPLSHALSLYLPSSSLYLSRGMNVESIVL
jgi:hypothetical protein